MAAIPFTGARDVTVYKLPYTLPLLSSLGLLWQIWSTQSEPGVLADSFASLQDVAESYTTTIYRLTPSALISYPLIGSSPTQNIGAPFLADGCNAILTGAFPATPSYARYALPSGGGAVNVVGFTAVTAPENPPFFSVYQLIRFYPVVQGGVLAYRLFCQDSSFSPWYTILNAASMFTDWVNAPIAEGSAVLDFTNNRTLIFTGLNVLALAVSALGVESVTTLYASTGTGHSWIDDPSFTNSFGLNGWLASADNTVAGSGPLVTDGSPVFLIAPDLSGYSELVFHPGAADVLPNDLGIYGPAWDYGSEFQSRALCVVDVDGNLYYIQLNPAGTAYDVYSTAAPAGGRVHGTHYGFMLAGQFSGGNK